MAGYADYAAWDSQDNAGGAAYTFLDQERPSSPVVHQPSRPHAPAHAQAQAQAQVQQPQAQVQQPQAQVQQPQAQSNGYNGSMSSSQADADRQMMFLQMQEHLQQQQQQQQQNGQRYGWLDQCWQRRRDVLKLAMMSLVVMLALATHWVAVHYLKTYVESGTLSEWRELFARMAYPVATLLVLWAIKGAQGQGPGQVRGQA